MRGDRVWRVYGMHSGRDRDVGFGTFRTRESAQACVEALEAREMHGRSWAQSHHDRGFEIREIVVDTDFDVPDLPKPRDRYFVRTTQLPNPPYIPSTTVEVLERRESQSPRTVCSYVRNLGMFQTFEPFRQRGRNFALISRDYRRTAVIDLDTGAVVAEEAETEFCPVGFYVPDWWDVYDDSVIPGSDYWNRDCEWPTGDFGFVWGCVWGDDSVWKVRYLDLGRVSEGLIVCEERFGYLELATGDYVSPCFEPDPPACRSQPPPFVSLSRHAGRVDVRFCVPMHFDLASGVQSDWRYAHPPDRLTPPPRHR